MKNLSLLILVILSSVFFSTNGISQWIGTGTTSTDGNYGGPFYNYYENAKTQMLYKASELGGAGSITDISFDISQVSTNSGTATSGTNHKDLTNFSIKLMHSSTTSFTAYETTTSATEVYSGASTYAMPSSTGWLTFDITDFAYNGTSNLLVEIVWGDNGVYSNTPYLVNHTDYSSGAEYLLTFGRSDSETPPNYDGRSYIRPNVQFTKAVYGIPTISSFTPSSGCTNTGTVVITGTNFSGTSSVTIGGTAVSSFTVDNDTQITATLATGTTGTIAVTNSAGTASSSGSFTVFAPATITGTLNLCEGASTQLIGSAPTAGSTWSSATPSVATVSATGLVIGVSAGTSVITYTDGNGCDVDEAVTVDPNVTPTFAQLGPYCVGDVAGTLPTTSTNGATGTWDAAISTSANGTITYTFTASSGCFTTATMDVVVNTTPTLTVQDTATCPPNSIDLTNTAYWSADLGTVSYFESDGTTPVVDATALGVGSYVIEADNLGCVSSANLTVSVSCACSAVASISLTGANTICGGICSEISITVGSGIGNYNVLYTDGTTNFNLNNVAAGTFPIQVCPTLTATYTIQSVEDIGNDCFGVFSGSAAITVNPLPIVSAGPDQTICAGDQVTLIGSGASSYSWDNGVTDGVSFTPSIGVNTYTVTGTDANGCIGTDMLSVTSTPISLSVLRTNVTCNGGDDGAIDINFNSAGAPYTFQWSNGETTQNLQNLSAGLYSLTINSAIGCDTTIQVSINQPPPLQTNIDITNTLCGNQDGTVALVIINPYNQPYTTTWSNGDVGLLADSLSSGSINAIITDAIGCLFYDAAMIGSSGGATVNISSVTNVSCPGVNDGAISLDVTTQNPPYTVNWISGQSTQQISGLGSGVYEYLVEDQSGCLTAGSAEILQPDSISLANVNLTSPTCGNNDGFIQVNGQGGSGNLIYIWGANTGSQQGATATNLYAGTYTLNVVDDNSCVHIETILLNDLSAPEIDIVNINNPQCGGGLGGVNIAVSNGTPPYSYLWSTDSTTQDINDLLPGNYVVLVSDALGCTSTEFIELNGILPPNPGVCLVTVDTTTQTNLVVWEKPLVAGSISHYNIYREGIAAGVYDSITTVPYDSLSQYTDTLANPSYRSWSYKISVVDTCGTESLPSPAHKTIHLTTNLGLSNVINLIWDNYAGFNYLTYYVNRYHPSTGWDVISILPSSLTSYTDQSPLIPSNTLIYSIEVVPPSTCTSTKAQDHNSTRSNRANIVGGGGQGIFQHPTNNVNIYPNPTSDQITIDIKGYNGVVNVKVYDLQGRLLETTTNTTVSLKKHPKGIYVLRVSYGEITEEVRVVRD